LANSDVRAESLADVLLQSSDTARCANMRHRARGKFLMARPPTERIVDQSKFDPATAYHRQAVSFARIKHLATCRSQ
jgi:hypothetical protein